MSIKKKTVISFKHDSGNDFIIDRSVSDEYGRNISKYYSAKKYTQEPLVSGYNIKTINGNSLLGSGDIFINPVTHVSQLINDSGFLTEHQDLNGLATEEYVNNIISEIRIPTKVSELQNDSGFLTEHQSLNDYALKSYVDTKISDILGGENILETYDTIKEISDYIGTHGREYVSLVEDVQRKADTSLLATVATTGSYNDLTDKPTPYLGFHNSWPTDNTTTVLQFCQAVNNDPEVKPGMVFLGGVRFKDMPFSGNGEVVVEIISSTLSSTIKVIHVTLISGNVAPYRWEYTYWNGNHTTDWISYQQTITNDNKLNANLINGLSSVATSGSYTDLINKPTIAENFDSAVGTELPTVSQVRDYVSANSGGILVATPYNEETGTITLEVAGDVSNYSYSEETGILTIDFE